VPKHQRWLQTDVGQTTGGRQTAAEPNVQATEINYDSIYRWASGIVFTLIGLPLCFFGILWWKVNSWIMGCMCGWFLGAAIQRMWVGEGNEVVQWIMLVVIVALTITLMLVFYFFPKFASMLLGASLGVLLTNIVFAMILASNGDEHWVWWITAAS
jgi:hypothetical protein